MDTETLYNDLSTADDNYMATSEIFALALRHFVTTVDRMHPVKSFKARQFCAVPVLLHRLAMKAISPVDQELTK